MPAGSPATATAEFRPGRRGTERVGMKPGKLVPAALAGPGSSVDCAALFRCLDDRSPQPLQFRAARLTTDRSVTIGINRSTPSSVAFSTSQSNRSPLGTAVASVSEKGAGRSGRGGPTASQLDAVVLDFDNLAPWIAWPFPSKTSTTSPTPSRHTRLRCLASSAPSRSLPICARSGQ